MPVNRLEMYDKLQVFLSVLNVVSSSNLIAGLVKEAVHVVDNLLRLTVIR